MYYFYGKINGGHVVCPLYGGGLYLGEFVMEGSTVPYFSMASYTGATQVNMLQWHHESRYRIGSYRLQSWYGAAVFVPFHPLVTQCKPSGEAVHGAAVLFPFISACDSM